MQSLLERHFSYNPETGAITRRTQQGKFPKGSKITTKDTAGYIRLQFQKKKILGHRLAWYLHYGEKPPTFIDHVNGIKDDNTILNLREATRSENQYNKSMPKNTTGIKGIHLHKQSGGYMAAISCNGKHYTKYSKTDLEGLKRWLDEKRTVLHKQYARA